MQATAAYTHATKESILDLMSRRGIDRECYREMLDYTINLFETKGLGTEYYGYHNIRHELEVTYMTLLAMDQDMIAITQSDIEHLYVAALFHDLDPLKNVDKPHEESVLNFISRDENLQRQIRAAGIDFEIVKVLILRTTYPWAGEMKKNAEERALQCFERSDMARDDHKFRSHVMEMGRYLSVIDRMSGYALGDFAKAMEMAKMNAHALGWSPSQIVRRAVTYFEDLLGNEDDMIGAIMQILPKQMRKNFYGTVLSFFQARQEEITIQAEHAYENLKLVPTIESINTRTDPEFISTLRHIFEQLPSPLQLEHAAFEESVMDPEIILTTLRVNSRSGKIVGYAKGGPLERYRLREEIRDENHGMSNTIFLEPMGLNIGYWGLGGGSGMRNMFIMQASAKKYTYLTSFALRDVVSARVDKEEAEFVAQFDPERWDYYRISL